METGRKENDNQSYQLFIWMVDSISALKAKKKVRQFCGLRSTDCSGCHFLGSALLIINKRIILDFLANFFSGERRRSASDQRSLAARLWLPYVAAEAPIRGEDAMPAAVAEMAVSGESGNEGDREYETNMRKLAAWTAALLASRLMHPFSSRRRRQSTTTCVFDPLPQRAFVRREPAQWIAGERGGDGEGTL